MTLSTPFYFIRRIRRIYDPGYLNEHEVENENVTDAGSPLI